MILQRNQNKFTRPQTATLSFLQINLRHSKLASASLGQLLLDMNIDAVLIQEPYATRETLSSSITVANVPIGYNAFHALSSEHAFGSAIIIRESLRAIVLPVSNNEVTAVQINHFGKNLTLLSAYARPSARGLSSVLAAPLSSLSATLSETIISLASNGRTHLWNSAVTDQKGRELENLLYHNLHLANRPLTSLEFTPPSTSFVDVTSGGININFSSWQFLSTPSLSDHPYIFFKCSSASAQTQMPPCPQLRKRFPNLTQIEMCAFSNQASNFLNSSTWKKSLISLGQDCTVELLHHAIGELSNLVSIAKSCKQRATRAPRQAAARLPWWNTDLWALRHKLRTAYKAWAKSKDDANNLAYRRLKSEFQLRIRRWQVGIQPKQ